MAQGLKAELRNYSRQAGSRAARGPSFRRSMAHVTLLELARHRDCSGFKFSEERVCLPEPVGDLQSSALPRQARA